MMRFLSRGVEVAYRYALKPLLFLRDPEAVHDAFTRVGVLLASSSIAQRTIRSIFRYDDDILATNVAGIRFQNPIGLAAGFDKNARLTNILPDVGFGFAELGSITGKPCAGNSGTRLWRLPKSKGLVVYYGLKNDGADSIAGRMRRAAFRLPIGISAAKTNSKETIDADAAIDDYAHVVESFRGIGDYYTINISCPNAFGGEPFTDPTRLDALLTRIDALADKPVFLKLAVDLSHAELDAIIAVCNTHRIAGFVCSNLTKRRQNAKIVEQTVPEKGGISGMPVQSLSDAQVAYVYRATRGAYAIIGVGGVFTGKDAYRKIRLGASLIQLITGMIYRGPQTIGQINAELAALLRRDGFKNVADVVGVDNHAKDSR